MWEKLTLQLGNYKNHKSVRRGGKEAGSCITVIRSARPPVEVGPLPWCLPTN